jgi:flagellin
MALTASILTSIGQLNEIIKAYYSQFEKLDSGTRLNRTSQGAAEWAISSSLRGRLASFKQGFMNLNDAVSLLQTAESSLQAISAKLSRMLELASQAQSGTLSPSQIQILQEEFDNLSLEIYKIAQTAEYNGIPIHQQKQRFLFTATGTEIPIQLEEIPLFEGDVDNPAAYEALKSFAEFIQNYRARLAATLNSVEGLSDYLNTLLEQTTQAESQITDTDYAQELLDTSFQIEAGTETLSLYNQLSSQLVLSLLQEK